MSNIINNGQGVNLGGRGANPSHKHKPNQSVTNALQSFPNLDPGSSDASSSSGLNSQYNWDGVLKFLEQRSKRFVRLLNEINFFQHFKHAFNV